MESIREGDQIAFAELYDRYHQRVFAYLWRALRDSETAADLRQEVFLRAWRTRARWKGTGSVAGFLIRVARGVLLDHHRRQRVRSLWLVRAAADPPPHSESPDAELTARRISARVDAAVAALPDRMREVFSLKRDAGLSYLEISEQLGISVKTVEVHMGRAFRQLREALADLRTPE